MRGFLIGIFYCIQGVWYMVFAFILLLFVKVYKHRHYHWGALSCGSVFYLVTIVLGLLGIVAYVLAAYCYKQRRRGGQMLVNERAILENYFEQSTARNL